jgi:hypothetical protein
MLSRLADHLTASEPEDLMLPVILLLICALPIGGLLAVFGLLNAGTFLQILLLGGVCLAVLAMFLKTMYRRVSEPGAEKTTGRLPKSLENSYDVRPVIRETGFVGPWLTRYDAQEQGPDLNNFAPDLLDDMMRSRGQGHLYYYQGL